MLFKFMSINTRKQFKLLLLLSILSFTFIFQSCKKRSDIGKNLYLKTKNKAFQDVTPEGLDSIFQQVLAKEKSKITYPQVIRAFYAHNQYDPIFSMDHIFNNDLKTATEYYQRANEHGLDPTMFKGDEIAKLIKKFYDPKAITTTDEAYHAIAELEILSANSLIMYTNALQYGIVNPKRIYSRYFTATVRPDTTSMTKALHVGNLKAYLDSIQPKDPQYLALQKILMSGQGVNDLSPEETKRFVMVNMERLRWRNKPAEKKYVIVNIPDFKLDVIDSGHSVLNMKVCVGQGRNMHYEKTLMHYDDTDRVDKPNPHSTPQLSSLIHSVDVNPVWNIPQSIANKEIIVQAADDKFYLANKGINVYRNGKLIDPESVDWSTVTKENSSDYEFKQKPGNDNSLGKIKFLFNNRSSVYLHDTPAKDAFRLKMRAVSHGCVRLGNPNALALNLFGTGDKYDLITKDMASDNPEPTTINLSPKTPVYITYVTGWIDADGALQIRPDVYGLDIVLYNALTNIK
jgi:murein L,D-transpeptidase YcbB/YkuD